MVKFGFRSGPDAITTKRAFDLNAIVKYVQRTTFVKVFAGIYGLFILLSALGIAFLPAEFSALISVVGFSAILSLVYMVYHFYLWGLAVGQRNLTFKNWAFTEAIVIIGAMFLSVIPFVGTILWVIANGLVFPNKATLKDLIVIVVASILITGLIAFLTTGAFLFQIGRIGLESIISI